MGDIYCKNCDFFHHNMFDYALVTCERKYGLPYGVKNPMYGEVLKVDTLPERHPESRNYNLNCIWFKDTPWWKIWK